MRERCYFHSTDHRIKREWKLIERFVKSCTSQTYQVELITRFFTCKGNTYLKECEKLPIKVLVIFTPQAQNQLIDKDEYTVIVGENINNCKTINAEDYENEIKLIGAIISLITNLM